MDDRRVIFHKGRQKQLLRLSKQMSQLTWEGYSSYVGSTSYNALRAAYLNEHCSLPQTMLEKVLQFVSDDNWKSWIVDFREPHWGQAKGGRISLNAWHARMRHYSAKYHAVQSRRFRKSRAYKYRTSAGYEVRSLYELVIAENLIKNLVPHQYEKMLRCGERLLFSFFSSSGGI